MFTGSSPKRKSTPYAERTNSASRAFLEEHKNISAMKAKLKQKLSKTERLNLEEQLGKSTKRAQQLQKECVNTVVGDMLHTTNIADGPKTIQDIKKSLAKGEALTPQEKTIATGIDNNVTEIQEKVKENPSFLKKLESNITKYSIVLAIIGGGLSYLWKWQEGSNIEGCYQFPACADGGAKQMKMVSCSKDNCNCANIEKCSLPACNMEKTGCLQYFYTNFTTTDIVASLPDIMKSIDDDPEIKQATFRKNLIRFLLIASFIIFVAYFLIKTALKNKNLF